MALRIEKAAGALVAAVLIAAGSQAAELRYRAVHDHLYKGGSGTLVIGDAGIGFEETHAKPQKRPHVWQWSYDDLQQLTLMPQALELLTYRDNKWKLGADRRYRFQLPASGSFHEAHEFLKSRLDQRFVAALADTQLTPEWEMPVKHRRNFGGSEGVLRFGADAVVYSTGRREDARTWRWMDIENISSSGPFELTITTFELARARHGNRRAFNFQLKRPLEEARYNELWQRVNRSKGLQVLNSYRERNETE